MRFSTRAASFTEKYFDETRWREFSERIEYLQMENAELKLYLSATLRLLIKKGVIEPSELRDIVNAVDQSDGDRDGGYDGPMV